MCGILSYSWQLDLCILLLFYYLYFNVQSKSVNQSRTALSTSSWCFDPLIFLILYWAALMCWLICQLSLIAMMPEELPSRGETGNHSVVQRCFTLAVNVCDQDCLALCYPVWVPEYLLLEAHLFVHPGAYGVLLPSSARCRCQCICLHIRVCLLETSQNFMILTGSGLALSICLSNIFILSPIIWRTCFRWKYSAVLHLSDKCRYVSIRELYVGRISSTSSHALISSTQKDILFKNVLRNIVSTSRWLWISIYFF